MPDTKYLSTQDEDPGDADNTVYAPGHPLVPAAFDDTAGSWINSSPFTGVYEPGAASVMDAISDPDFASKGVRVDDKGNWQATRPIDAIELTNEPDPLKAIHQTRPAPDGYMWRSGPNGHTGEFVVGTVVLDAGFAEIDVGARSGYVQPPDPPAAPVVSTLEAIRDDIDKHLLWLFGERERIGHELLAVREARDAIDKAMAGDGGLNGIFG